MTLRNSVKSGTVNQPACHEQEEDASHVNESQYNSFDREAPALVGKKIKNPDAVAEMVIE